MTRGLRADYACGASHAPGRSVCASALACAVAACFSGCMIPSYHLPGGFSSTYQRQIYGIEPVANDAPYLGLAAVESRRGIFYPTSVFAETHMASQSANDKKKSEPLLLGTDPLNPEQTAKHPSLDAL